MASTYWDEVKQAKPAQTTVPVGVGPTPLVPYSNSRVALIISASSAQAVFVSYGNSGVAGVGILLPANGLPLVISADQYGQLLCGPFMASAPGGATTISFIEVLHVCPCMG